MDYFLANLKVCRTKFFLVLFKVGNINIIVKDNTTDTSFDDSSYYSYSYVIFFCLLFPNCCYDGPRTCFYKVLDVFLNKYGLSKIRLLQPIIEVRKLFPLRIARYVVLFVS